jgi:hypothetical protein
MSDPEVSRNTDAIDNQDAPSQPGGSRRGGLLVWGAVSLGFLALLSFGSLEARIWRFNRLYFEDRKILDVWAYEGRNLPDISAQGFFTALYYAAVIALVLGAILGLWLLLDEAGTGARRQTSSGADESPEHA